jgi:hypothetical protein
MPFVERPEDPQRNTKFHACICRACIRKIEAKWDKDTLAVVEKNS